MFLLLKYFPYLEALTLAIYKVEGCDMTWEQLDDRITCLESKLKLVHFINFEDGKKQLKFIRFLVKHELVLEKLIIFSNESAKKSSSLAETILGFPTSSADLAVTVLPYPARIEKLEWKLTSIDVRNSCFSNYSNCHQFRSAFRPSFGLFIIWMNMHSLLI